MTAVLIDPPLFHGDCSQSMDGQGIGLSTVSSFLIGGRCFVDAEALRRLLIFPPSCWLGFRCQ